MDERFNRVDLEFSHIRRDISVILAKLNDIGSAVARLMPHNGTQ
jgi:hypothetical protein